MHYIFFSIAFLASSIGAISGLGGGIIIKPLLDGMGHFDSLQINFLSGCTVLAMATISLIKSKYDGNLFLGRNDLTLALSGCVGGILGKLLLDFITQAILGNDSVLLLQSYILILINAGMIIYLKIKAKIVPANITNKIACVITGVFLGGLSSFLGIGGGAMNIGILCAFFSMTTKQAAESSLFIIFCAQLFSLLTSISTSTVPPFSIEVLSLMLGGGILGALAGNRARRQMSGHAVEKMLSLLLLALICLSIYNIFIFKGYL